MSGGVRAGSREHYLTIQPLTLSAEGSSGYETPTYPEGDWFYLWGSVRPLRGREKFNAGREMATVYYEFKTDFDSRVNVRDRIVWDGLEFDIQDVSPMGTQNREFLTIVGELLEKS